MPLTPEQFFNRIDNPATRQEPRALVGTSVDTLRAAFLAATQVHRIEDVSSGEIGSYEYPSLSDALAEIQDVTTWTRVRNHRDRVVCEINRPDGV